MTLKMVKKETKKKMHIDGEIQKLQEKTSNSKDLKPVAEEETLKRKSVKSTEPKRKKKKIEEPETNESEMEATHEEDVEASDDEETTRKKREWPKSKSRKKKPEELKDVNFLITNLPKSWDKVEDSLLSFFSERDVQLKHGRPGSEALSCYVTVFIQSKPVMKSLNGVTFQGKSLKIKRSDKSLQSKVHIGNIDQSKLNRQTIMRELSGAKDLCIVPIIGRAHLHFDDPEKAAALVKKETLTINGCKMKLSLYQRPVESEPTPVESKQEESDKSDSEQEDKARSTSGRRRKKKSKSKKSVRIQPPAPYEFFIGNLPNQFPKMKARLEETFKELGIVIRSLRGQKNKWCYCSIEGTNNNKLLMESLDGHEMEGRQLEVRRADAIPGTVVRAREVDAGLVSEANLVAETDCIDAVVYYRKTYGYAYFDKEAEAQALANRSPVVIKGCELKISMHKRGKLSKQEREEQRSKCRAARSKRLSKLERRRAAKPDLTKNKR